MELPCGQVDAPVLDPDMVGKGLGNLPTACLPEAVPEVRPDEFLMIPQPIVAQRGRAFGPTGTLEFPCNPEPIRRDEAD